MVGENFEIAIESLSILIRILYPITPHITDFLWEKLGFEKINGNLNLAPWPYVDYKALIEEEVEISEDPAWTYRFLIPISVAIATLVIVGNVIQYFRQVTKKRYKVIKK